MWQQNCNYKASMIEKYAPRLKSANKLPIRDPEHVVKAKHRNKSLPVKCG